LLIVSSHDIDADDGRALADEPGAELRAEGAARASDEDDLVWPGERSAVTKESLSEADVWCQSESGEEGLAAADCERKRR
jgi:hypothetical protein